MNGLLNDRLRAYVSELITRADQLEVNGHPCESEGIWKVVAELSNMMNIQKL